LRVDKSYDFPRFRHDLRHHGIPSRIVRCGIESPERLGRGRADLAWFYTFAKLRIRFERRTDIHRAWLILAVVC
jgi:hypothetical protein